MHGLDGGIPSDAGQHDGANRSDATAPDALPTADAGPIMTYPEGFRCGDGIVRSGEDCDDGNRIAGDGCSAACEIETGASCDSPAPAWIFDGGTEPGAGAASAWTWVSAGRPVASSAITTDEASCAGGYLRNAIAGSAEAEGWISPAGTGCGAPMRGNLIFARSFLAPAGATPIEIAIGHDNGLFAVRLNGASVPLTRLSHAGEYSAPSVIARLLGVREGVNDLEIEITEAGAPAANNNTGIYVNRWSPSVCVPSDLGYGCGDGVRASTEDCDDGDLVDLDGCSDRCTVESPFTCDHATPRFTGSTERGSGTASAWSWVTYLDPSTPTQPSAARTTDEASCAGGQLRSAATGSPGADGWISVMVNGCGSAQMGRYVFTRSFIASSEDDLEIGIGTDGTLTEVRLNGVPQATRTVSMRAHAAPRDVATLTGVRAGVNQLEIEIEETSSPGPTNNTGIWVAPWAPSQCRMP